METRPISRQGWMKEKGGNGFNESTTVVRQAGQNGIAILINDEREHLNVTRCRQKMLADQGSTEFRSNLKIIGIQVNPN